MKILVTGGSGYFGKPLVERLMKSYQVVNYDLVEGNDVLDYSKLRNAMKGCDIVVHCAAITKPVESKSFDAYFMINCVGTMNVVKAAIEVGVKKMVFISSTAYYGVERGIPVKLPTKETQQTAPMYLKADDFNCKECDLMYSQSKVIGENILAFYGLRKKIQIILLRFPRIGGKEGPHGTKVSVANAINGVVKSIEAKGTFWFEAFNVADKLDTVDISKAEKMLGYDPI
ncbi:MAG: NAD(P)-dependent oxidoreductase [archaeon]